MSDPEFMRFASTVRNVVSIHPIVRHNRYTVWFSQGTMTRDELRHFTVQFSVFSHLFLEAQLRKCINAPTLQSYRASKEILLNELGVPFGQAGSVDGSPFRFGAAHFEWLIAFGAHLGLGFDDLGKRASGTEATLEFCRTLAETYGSENASTAAGASYAIEHWAAAGFWKELISGLREYRRRSGADLPLGFWTWHDRLEDQHAEHTDDELADAYRSPSFDETALLAGAETVLDSVAVFWNGLVESGAADRSIFAPVA